MRIVNSHLVLERHSIPLSRLEGVFLLAVGKASSLMMKAALNRLGNHAIGGILVTPSIERPPKFDDRIETFLSGHPIPNQTGLKASQRVIQALDRLKENQLLLCLISGGASAMLPAPAKGITLGDKINVTKQLITSGASIHEINTIRRHISKLKGGRLVGLCRASRIVSLMLSDVPGNNLADIGSGLTVQDSTSYRDAIEIFEKYHLWDQAPDRVKNHLSKGARGLIQDTPEPTSRDFQRVRNIIVADGRTACMAAQRFLRKKNLRSSILTTSVETEARKLGSLLAAEAAGSRTWPRGTLAPRAVIIGGECVTHVTGKGVGGRNQEVALSALNGIAGHVGIAVAAIGTDGIDGNTKVAGAIVDGNSAERASRMKLDSNRFLARNDSGRFFRLLGDQLLTGPTGTNVGDIYLMISVR